MLTQEPIATKSIAQKPRWPRAIVAFAATIVIVATAVGVWAFTGGDGGPVASADAQIEITFDGNDATYTGHRQIIEGRAEIVLTNASTGSAWFVVQRFDTGSNELTAELARAAEGADFVTTDGPLGEAKIMEEILPESGSFSGNVTRPIRLEAGSTYVLEAGLAGEESTRIWRAAVIEVVAAD
jgi:hypothetical protein